MKHSDVSPQHTLRRQEPLSWTFHRGTARWIFNAGGGRSAHQLPGREDPNAPWTPLPRGALPDCPLHEAMAGRVSCRAFDQAAVPLSALAAVLRAAYGVGGRHAWQSVEVLDRPSPSAGGLYPLETSLLVKSVDGLDAGTYHYVPLADGLECLRAGALPKSFVSYLFMGQPWVAEAAVVLVISAVPERTLPKYGDRGYRYLLLEAGHVMQSMNLVASGLGLGMVNLGGFYDDELAGLIRLDPEREFPLYAAAFGRPAASVEGDRMGMRALDDAFPA